LQTLIIALVALVVGSALCRHLGFLRTLNVPSPVVAGVLVAILTAVLHRTRGLDVTFATGVRDFLLLVFFTTIGLSAKLSDLRSGGKPLAILCAITVLLLVVQNVAGVLVATAIGAHPFYGLLAGSISFVGGPGTAVAWAKEATAMGLTHAPEVAIASATLAVVTGAIVSGPITGWLITSRKLHGPAIRGGTPWIEPGTPKEEPAPPTTVEATLRALLLILVAVAIGAWINSWGRAFGLVLPGFLTALLGGAAITNTASLFRWNLNLRPVERGGEIALQIFLASSLMSMQLWTVTGALGPLLANVLIQVVVTTLLAVFLLFPALGRDYDAGVTVGGFLGFGLSSMPVAMATMDEVASRYGPSPKAFLLITLAGSFFVDLANAFVVRGFLALSFFHR
jgi:ESS family glutamate:Na+ symporter